MLWWSRPRLGSLNCCLLPRSRSPSTPILLSHPLSSLTHSHLSLSPSLSCHQLYDQFRASELAAHDANLVRLAGLDRARILKQRQQEVSEEELAQLKDAREKEWPYELLRFLRAYKWELPKTVEAYHAYLQWRLDKQVDSMHDGLPFNAELIDRLIANNAAGEDKKGFPIYWEKSGNVRTLRTPTSLHSRS